MTELPFWKFKDQREKWTLGLAVLALLAALASALFTGLQWTAANRSAKASEDSAKSSADSAKAAIQQFEVSERPWVFITNSQLVSPLVFDESGAHVTLRFYLKNSGHSPALNVQVRPELFVWTNGNSPTAEREKVCNPQGPPPETPGTVLFPDTVTPQDITVMVSREDMEKSAKQKEGIILTVPIVCIAYRPAFKDARYSTAIVYSLWPAIRFADAKPGYSIPIGKIPFQQNSFFGEVAK
jgi:hypothetical protein